MATDLPDTDKLCVGKWLQEASCHYLGRTRRGSRQRYVNSFYAYKTAEWSFFPCWLMILMMIRQITRGISCILILKNELSMAHGDSERRGGECCTEQRTFDYSSYAKYEWKRYFWSLIGSLCEIESISTEPPSSFPSNAHQQWYNDVCIFTSAKKWLSLQLQRWNHHRHPPTTPFVNDL